MRNFKDIIQSQTTQIDEGILGSVKAGRENLIKDWVEKYCKFGTTLEPNGHVLFTTDKDWTEIDIPVIIDRCNNIKMTKCTMKNFTIPSKFKTIKIIGCSNLENILCPVEAFGDELIIEDCDALIDIDIDKLHVKNVIISKCNNYSELSKMRYIENLLQIENCKKLRTYNLNNEFSCSISIYRCPLKYYKNLVVAREFELDNILKVSDIELEIGAAIDVKILGCSSLENVTIKGQNPQALVIDNCHNMKVIDCQVNPTFSLSYCNMNNLEDIKLPHRLNCHATFKKINLKPEVKAKSVTFK